MLVFLAVLNSTLPAQTLTTLHSFRGAPDGYNPSSAIVLDQDGNAYGTTFSGGNSTTCNGGCGTVFKVALDGTETVFYNFAGRNDGANPNFLELSGTNLVGTTLLGGIYGEKLRRFGLGTIFAVTLTGQKSTSHSFRGGVHSYPQGLSKGPDGQFGATTAGSSLFRTNKRYNGSVMNTVTRNDRAILKFHGSDPAAGEFPTAGLAFDAQGNLYGTTTGGGTNGSGVLFEVGPKGGETILYNFGSGGNDAGQPSAGLTGDKQDNFYGTTATGGSFGAGAVFKVTSSGIAIVHNFGGADGDDPQSLLIFDAQGNLYGTTDFGGVYNQGTVYKLTTSGQETVLYSFTGGTDGAHPQAALVFDSQGNLYGTTTSGGANGLGTVFKLVP
jgi:uncharacterized repeat protein (TIGR03803 family)